MLKKEELKNRSQNGNILTQNLLHDIIDNSYNHVSEMFTVEMPNGTLLHWKSYGHAYMFWTSGEINHDWEINFGEVLKLASVEDVPPLKYIDYGTISVLNHMTLPIQGTVPVAYIHVNNEGVFFEPVMDLTIPRGTESKVNLTLILSEIGVGV